MSSKYRINYFSQIKAFFTLVYDSDFYYKPQHIALYCFLLQQNNSNGWKEWFMFPFDLAMEGSRISSRNTYYKVLADLSNQKLLKYEKGSNAWKAPRVSIIPLKVDAQKIAPTITCTNNVPIQVQVQVVEQLAIQLAEQLAILQEVTLIRPIDYKTIRLKDLKQIIEKLEVLSDHPSEEEKEEITPIGNSDKLEIIGRLMDYFSFNEIDNHDKLREANIFISVLQQSGKLKMYQEQFTAYKTYKQNSQQKKHGWRGFLGTQEENFLDGGWNAENWQALNADTPAPSTNGADAKELMADALKDL